MSIKSLVRKFIFKLPIINQYKITIPSNELVDKIFEVEKKNNEKRDNSKLEVNIPKKQKKKVKKNSRKR